MIKKTFFAVLFLLSVVIISCSRQEKESLLIQRWVIGKVDFGVAIPEQSRAVMEPMLEQIKMNSYLNFNKDYSFEGSAFGMNAMGTWNINDDGSVIYLMDKKTHREEKIVIEKLTKDSLIFSAEAQGQPLKFTFIPVRKH